VKFYIFADTSVHSTTYNWQLVHAAENFPDFIYGSPIEQDKAFAYNIKMEKEMNRAGSLTFTIGPEHPLVNSMFPLGTTIKVDIDCDYDAEHHTYTNGHNIWYGRVLTIEKTFNLERNITCEGALAFLNDVMVRPRKYFWASGQNENKAYNMSAIKLMDELFGEYNAIVTTKAYKRKFDSFVVVTPYDPTDPDSYNGYINYATYASIDDYRTFFDMFSEIAGLDPKVGIWAEYRDDSGDGLTLFVAYLPWGESVKRIEFANNLVDYKNNGDGLEIYNAVIPLGANKIRLSEDCTWHSPSGENYKAYMATSDYMASSLLGEYGYIEKTIDYSECTDRTTLEAVAQANLTAYEKRKACEFNVTAVELAWLSEVRDEGYTPILLADMFEHDSDESQFNPNNFLNIGWGAYFNAGDAHGQDEYDNDEFVCSALSMDLDNPGATEYRFQIYDNYTIPTSPKMLTEYYDRAKAKSAGILQAVAQNGTTYYQMVEPTRVKKIDDNTVVTETADHEEVYTATGSGDERSDITKEDVAKGTYFPSNNNS